MVIYESMSKFVKILVFFIFYENLSCDLETNFYVRYSWSCLIMLTDKTVSYWCENIFFIDLKPLFSSFLPVPRKNLKFRQELLNNLVSEEFQLSVLMKAFSK